MTDANNPRHPIHGTAGGRPATMSVLLEDGEVEIFAPPFFRMDEGGALQLADMLMKYFLPEQEIGLHGWWRVDARGAEWKAPLSAWNPDNEMDDGK